MREFSTPSPRGSSWPLGPLDDSLWEKITTSVGGSTRFRRALVIDGPGPQPQVVVIVVERGSLPGNAELRRRFGLTPRESEVARLLADRSSNEEIAGKLGISVHTVRRHCERVLSKLAINTRNRVRTTLLASDYPVATPCIRTVA